MTSSEDQPGRATVVDLQPRRWREGDGPVAEAARDYQNGTTGDRVDETAAWYRLRVRLHTTSRRLRWRVGLGAASLIAGVAVIALLLSAGQHRETSSGPGTRSEPVVALPPTAPAPAQEPAAAAAAPVPPARSSASPRPRRLSLSASRRTLPAGQVDLDGEALAFLAQGGRAVVSTDAGSTRVSLSRGSLRLDVKPQAPGHRFVVESGPYRFVVVGTSFRLARSAEKIELWVFEGRVAVWLGQDLGSMVASGGHWLAALRVTTKDQNKPAPPPQSPAMATTPTPSVRRAPLTSCEAAGGAGRLDQALDCYRRVSEGSDLEAELALYEAARLQIRLTGAQAALDTLDTYARRFPNGALRTEVDLTRLQLLPRIGEHRRALEMSDRLLRENPDHKRRRDLRLLRGNIFREALNDCHRAEPEYAAAAEGAGRAADDAAFYRVLCVEIRGRTDEAVAGYRAYLARPTPAHEKDARRRLSALER